MKNDLLNAKLRIRMYTVFEHLHEYNGRMLEKIKLCYEFFYKKFDEYRKAKKDENLL